MYASLNSEEINVDDSSSFRIYLHDDEEILNVDNDAI